MCSMWCYDIMMHGCIDADGFLSAMMHDDDDGGHYDFLFLKAFSSFPFITFKRVPGYPNSSEWC